MILDINENSDELIFSKEAKQFDGKLVKLLENGYDVPNYHQLILLPNLKRAIVPSICLKSAEFSL
jgi:hypothetical protein